MTSTPTSPKQFTLKLWHERRDRWAAMAISALLHLLMLLLLLHSNPPVVSSPQGSSGGGRVKVDFVGEAPPSTQPSKVPPQDKPNPAKRSQPKATTHRRSEDRKPIPEARYIEPPSEPEQEQQSQDQAQAPAVPAATPTPSETVPRRPQTWTGRPPGSLDRTTATDDYGRSAGQGNDTGRSMDRSAGAPAMEVGGYQIIYDLLSEEKLRAWMHTAKEVDGKKEISIPLPGTTYLMVCPAEVALRRGSSKCRMLQAGSPELQDIGDAREFVIVMYVYRYGELLWRGPGPYR